jgi:hypothetical protein
VSGLSFERFKGILLQSGQSVSALMGLCWPAVQTIGPFDYGMPKRESALKPYETMIPLLYPFVSVLMALCWQQVPMAAECACGEPATGHSSKR